MAINLKDGFIYFLRETDVLTSEIGDYVKIGKTDFDRPVSDRINEHQTGNPRHVFEHASFQVPSIDTVETHLHHAFAQYRVLGEWFRMDDNGLKEAIEEGHQLARRLEDDREVLRTAAAANKVEANKPKRPASDTEKQLLESAVHAGEVMNRLEAKRSCVEWELRAGMGSARGIEGILEVASVRTQPKLDEERLASERPEIYEKCLVDEERLQRSFALATKARSAVKLEPELCDRRESFKAQAVNDLQVCDKSVAERTKRLARLHGQYLEVLGELSCASIAKDLIEARMKAACGTAQGIEGVCTWSRSLVTRAKLDRNQLARNHPALFQLYLLRSMPSSGRVSVRLMRSYWTA